MHSNSFPVDGSGRGRGIGTISRALCVHNKRGTLRRSKFISLFYAPPETGMSQSIPQEILDLIIDYLHDEPTTLKRCCIVSKAWIPRAQKHLFVTVKFRFPWRPVSQWRVTFPDPTNSPALHTRTLFISNLERMTAADADTFRTFCGVVHLGVHADSMDESPITVPLHGFFPALRSLYLSSSLLRGPEFFDFICSFPLLEDLILVARTYRHENTGWNTPSTSPRLTGSLDLRRTNGSCLIANRLLDLPNGLHFTKIAISWFYESEVLSTVSLISRCSDTLESLDITNRLHGTLPSARAQFMAGSLTLHLDSSGTPSIDLSKATKLKDITFRCGDLNVGRITTALQTIEPNTIEQVTIMLIHGFFSQETNRAWRNLDSLLVQFWTSHSPRLRVVSEIARESKGEKGRDKAARLLPELTKRVNVDLRLSAELRGPTFPSSTTASMLEWA